MKRLFGSLSFRLALIYVGLFAASLLLVVGTFYLIAIHLPLEQARGEVERDAKFLQNTYIVDGAAALATRLQARDKAPASRRAFHAFIDPAGRVVSANLRSWPRERAEGWLRLEADDYLEGDEVDYEPLTIDHSFADGARLLVGRDIEDISEVEEVLQSGALGVLAVALVVGLVGGALMSRAIGRRIEAVSSTARQVMGGDLAQRVPLRGNRDDFDRLAETLNLMLERIEEAVEAVRRVSDSVAHELRTPLTRLRADLEDMASVPEDGREERLAAAIGEADRLDRIFDAVLRIARIEAGRHAAAFTLTDLSTLLDDAIDYYRPAAEEGELELKTAIGPGLKVVADRDLLFQAMANLIDNAIKYTPAGGTIELTATAINRSVVIELRDNGPGVPAPALARITERFFRAAPTSGIPGAGLGLSLVAAIAALHGSKIAFECLEPGLGVRFTLPEAPAD